MGLGFAWSRVGVAGHVEITGLMGKEGGSGVGNAGELRELRSICEGTACNKSGVLQDIAQEHVPFFCSMRRQPPALAVTSRHHQWCGGDSITATDMLFHFCYKKKLSTGGVVP